MLMATNATSAAAAITIHMCGLILTPPLTAQAEGVNALLLLLNGNLRLPLRIASYMMFSLPRREN